jgi:DNA-binding MarR family transcriptional regulator
MDRRDRSPRWVAREIVSSVKLLKGTMDTVATSPTDRSPHVSTDETVETAARLRATTTRLFRLMRRHSPAGLSPSLLSALGTVRREGPLPIGALAEVEGIAAPTATKITDKLCAAGYVERRTDPTDRRVSLVAMTADGVALLDGIAARRTAWLTDRLRELPADERAALLTSLDVLEHLIALGADAPHDDDLLAPHLTKTTP